MGQYGTIWDYLVLSWTILDYPGLSRTISDCLQLSGTIWDYFRLSVTILDYLELSLTISNYICLSGTISDNLGLSRTISDYRASRSRREQVFETFSLYFFTWANPRGARAPKNLFVFCRHICTVSWSKLYDIICATTKIGQECCISAQPLMILWEIWKLLIVKF